MGDKLSLELYGTYLANKEKHSKPLQLWRHMYIKLLTIEK